MRGLPLGIPSPPINGIDLGTWTLGPVTVHPQIRFYALCIVAGILVAAWLGMRRWRARGGSPESFERVIVWAVVFGFVGARLYHVITDAQLYFGEGRNPWDAFKVWQGGLGIWGAVALGAVGAWIGCRRAGVRLASIADTVAPTLLIAQAIGRLGNWFNQELYGRPTNLPWAVQIDPEHRLVGHLDQATYHPTFLYEMLWNLGGAAILLWLDRRFRLGWGKVFWLYVAIYTAGRMWIEHLRIDPANTVGGFRLNEYTSWIIFALAGAMCLWLFRRRPGRENSPHQENPDATSETEHDPAGEDSEAETEDGQTGKGSTSEPAITSEEKTGSGTS